MACEGLEGAPEAHGFSGLPGGLGFDVTKLRQTEVWIDGDAFVMDHARDLSDFLQPFPRCPKAFLYRNSSSQEGFGAGRGHVLGRLCEHRWALRLHVTVG